MCATVVHKVTHKVSAFRRYQTWRWSTLSRGCWWSVERRVAGSALAATATYMILGTGGVIIPVCACILQMAYISLGVGAFFHGFCERLEMLYDPFVSLFRSVLYMIFSKRHGPLSYIA